MTETAALAGFVVLGAAVLAAAAFAHSVAGDGLAVLIMIVVTVAALLPHARP